MTFYGLADYSIREVIEFYASREVAERTLRDVLRDEPDWKGVVGIVRVEFGWDEARVEALWREADPGVGR